MLHEVLFGVRASDADGVAEQLGDVLDLRFEKHRSLYWGDYCLYRAAARGEIRVYRNHDPMHRLGSAPPEERFFEPRFPDCGVLVYAYLATDEQVRLQEGLRVIFPDAVLIRPEASAEPGAADRPRE
jgi:hypothetical protein